MKPLKRSTLFGNWATLLLPVTSDDAIDFAVLEEEIDRLISMEVDGIYSNGTAGEFFNQTEAEFDRVNALLAHKCEAAGMAFQIGCNHISPLMTLSRVERAVLLQPGALQVTLPDWVTTSFRETKLYLSRLMDAARPIPLVLYNPPHAKNVLQPKDYEQLCDTDIWEQLVGVKVFGGDTEWYQQMKTIQSDKPDISPLSIFIPGHFLASGISQGAAGSYSNVACLHPAVAQYWYDQTQTDLPAALALETRIQRWMQRYIHPFLHKNGYSNMAADKLLAAIGDWCPVGIRLRWPYLGFTESELVQLRVTAQAALPEFFDPVLRNYRKTAKNNLEK